MFNDVSISSRKVDPDKKLATCHFKLLCCGRSQLNFACDFFPNCLIRPNSNLLFTIENLSHVFYGGYCMTNASLLIKDLEPDILSWPVPDYCVSNDLVCCCLFRMLAVFGLQFKQIHVITMGLS